MIRKQVNGELKWGAFIIFTYLAWALLWLIMIHFFKGSFFRPYFPPENIKNELLPIGSSGFLLGTDIYGRSILEILSSGLVYSILLSLFVSFCAAVIGVGVGYLSVKGHFGIQKTSELLTNLIFVFPNILIAIMIMSVLGQSIIGLSFTLIFTGWPAYARIARGEILRVINLTYVEGAIAIGVSQWRLFFKVILPAILPIIIVHMILGVSGVIISEATLGFLGLGGNEYSWGVLLSMSKSVLLEAPGLVVIVSLTMAGLIIGLNLFGDGLRDYLDPKEP